MRRTGRLHGMEKRFSMWRCICEPRPRMNRPSEYACRSHATLATVIGVPRERHRDAGAQLDGLGVLRGQHERQERVVVDLGGPAAVVTPPLQPDRGIGDVAELARDGAVDLETAPVTHTRGRYSKQFSMVNVSTPVRLSPFDDGNCT